MTWYYLLFFACVAFFIIKTIISWVAGEVDVDFDADGDVDFDVSSMFSFKGFLHYLLGFSTYLSAIAKFEHPTESYVNFSLLEYLGAAFVGVVFMVVLFFLYKGMMKLNHNTDSTPNFEGCECSILTKTDDGTYGVLVRTHSGLFKKDFKSNLTDIKIGSKYHIANIENEFFVVL